MVDTKTFFTELASNLGQALGTEDLGIDIEIEIDNDAIESDLAVPLALFAAEAVTNAVKYAFPNPEAQTLRGWIRITYQHGMSGAVLSVEDNGNSSRSLDQGAGIGATLMAAFARQVRGTLEEGSPSGGGRYIRINIPHQAKTRTSQTIANAVKY